MSQIHFFFHFWITIFYLSYTIRLLCTFTSSKRKDRFSLLLPAFHGYVIQVFDCAASDVRKKNSTGFFYDLKKISLESLLHPCAWCGEWNKSTREGDIELEPSLSIYMSGYYRVVDELNGKYGLHLIPTILLVLCCHNKDPGRGKLYVGTKLLF